MDWWTTLWYAGAVVMQLGGENVSYNECMFLKDIMQKDIEQSYADPEKSDKLTQSMFPTNQFSVTCENEILAIDPRYLEEKPIL
jgi:hypothetical protein